MKERHHSVLCNAYELATKYFKAHKILRASLDTAFLTSQNLWTELVELHSLVVKVEEDGWHDRVCNVELCLHESTCPVHSLVPWEPISPSRIGRLKT